MLDCERRIVSSFSVKSVFWNCVSGTRCSFCINELTVLF